MLDGDGEEGCDLGHGRVVRETEKALLVDLDEHGEIWIPMSVIHDNSEVFDYGDGDNRAEGEVVVKTWWAEKEGLA